MNPILDMFPKKQPQQGGIDQQKAQTQWQSFLGQYGNCDPNQMLNQFVQQGVVSQQQLNGIMGLARTLTGIFHL